MEQTICAIASPLGIGGMSIVKLSGNKAKEIASKLFIASSETNQDFEPRKVILGNFSFGNITDKCILIYFKAPFSYTGEDVIEFQCHGGVYITEKILKACIASGALLANKGEFSLRAFMNGKVSIDEAEGIVDTINAESDSELLVGQRLQKGYLRKQIDDMQESLTSLLAKIDLSLDYPEHDDEVKVVKETKTVIGEVKKNVEKLLTTEKTGQTIRNGIQVAIIGKPNVGKSSVLNALIGSDRAIVSEIPGTTRDVVCETILHNGLKIKFSDTAGIRESEDAIEKLGIEKAKEEAKNADVVLAVFDGSTPLDNFDKKIVSIADSKNSIIIVNKSDKKQVFEIPNSIIVSAKSGKNISIIKDKIVSFVTNSKIDISGEVIINSRQATALSKSKSLIVEIENSIKNQTLDILAFLIKDLWNELGTITGKTENEEIIDEIFSKFCLGK